MFLWASRALFVSIVSLRKQAKMSFFFVSIKSFVCESWVLENHQKWVLFLWASRALFVSLVCLIKQSKWVSFLWASRARFVSLVSVRKQAKMSFIHVSFKNYTCESQKASKNEFDFCDLQELHLWVLENQQKWVLFLWALRTTFVNLVSLKKDAKMSFVSVGPKREISKSCE